MSKTAEEIMGRFKKPWLRYGQGERICVLYGLGRRAWRKMAPAILAREPDDLVGEKRYSRDAIIEVIEASLPK